MTNADDMDAIQIQPDPDKLLAYHRQQLSAMLDGELPPDQGKFMLRRLQHDGELAACWERWQVCGDVLRGRQHALLPSDFAARVAQRLQADAEVVPVLPEQAKSPRRLRWGGGAALAASVALVAVFAPRMFPDAADPSPRSGQPVLAAAGAGSDRVVEGLGEGRASADPTAVTDTPALPDVAPVVLATALAAAEAPRRNAERRARTASAAPSGDARTAQARAVEAPAPVVVAANDAAPVLDAGMAFPAPESLQPRPWPRAILPGAGESAFNVGYGPMSSALRSRDEAQGDAYAPFFRPRIEAPILLLPAEPSDAAGDDAGATDAAVPPSRAAIR